VDSRRNREYFPQSSFAFGNLAIISRNDKIFIGIIIFKRNIYRQPFGFIQAYGFPKDQT
jgi:hypothetical protein